MKRIIFKTSFIFLFCCASAARAANFDSVRTCIRSVQSSSNYQEYQKRIQTCFDLAKPLERSNILSGRALYLEALSLYLEPTSLQSYPIINRRLSNYYRSALKPFLTRSDLSPLSNQTLFDSFQAILMGLYFSAKLDVDESGLDRLKWIFQEMTVRGVATQKHAEGLLEFLLNNSEWEEAQDLSLSWPSLGPIPTLKKNSKLGRSLQYLTISDDHRSITLEPAQIDDGPRIVMFSDCHLSIDAIKKISEEKELSEIMKKVGLVLTDADFHDFKQWDSLKKQYPAFEHHPLYKEAEWTRNGFNIFGSPNFAFLLNGRTKYKIQGYGPTLLKDFCKGLHAIGVAAPSCTTP